MKRTLISLICLTLFFTGVASAQSGWVVTPGEGVGAITVGMTGDAAKAILTPTRNFGSPSNPALVQYGEALFIEYDSNKAVVISLHKNSFDTRSGVVSWVPYKGGAIGANWNSVAAQISARKVSKSLPTAKGQPTETYHAYSDLGLGFHVRGGTIVKVDIWKSKL